MVFLSFVTPSLYEYSGVYESDEHFVAQCGTMWQKQLCTSTVALRIPDRLSGCGEGRLYPISCQDIQSILKSRTLAYLSNRDKKNLVIRKKCGSQNTAKSVLISMVVGNGRFGIP